MDYLGRPVFPFAINWADPVSKRFSYDLRDLQLGFGAPVFTSLQETTIQGFSFAVDLQTDVAINACDLFFANLFGRLNGFWLLVPFEAMQIVAAVDTTRFTIRDQGLADTWNQTPDTHLFFFREYFDEDEQETVILEATARITSVIDLGNGLERVTLDTALNINLLHAGTTVRRLHYVRLTDDIERARFMAEGWQKRSFRVIELPLEYTEVETGQRPVWLYKFTLGNPSLVTWCYTSFAVNVASSGVNYTATAITHGSIRDGLKLEIETVQIEAAHDADHPLALFLPFAPSAKMFVEIIEIDYTAPNVQKKRFVGQVRKVRDAGDRLIAECESFLSMLNRKVPRMTIQPECNWQLFDVNCTLKANRFTYQRAIRSLLENADYPPVIYVDALEEVAANFFRGGFLWVGTGAHYEMRTILASEYIAGVDFRHKLTLNLPLRYAEDFQDVRFTRGCDGKAATCQAFNNFANFGGFISVPNRNPALKALDLPVNQGGKK